MYADVVVLTYQPPDIPAYTYKIPKKLEGQIKTGQLVSVPFGKRNPQGIVIKLSQGLPKVRDIRDIGEILLNQPILLPYQIELLGWMAFYYHAPMVNCLEAMLPKLTNVERLKTNELIKNVSRSSLVISQTLVLVPTINRIPETMAKYRQAKNYVIYHNELETREKFAAWSKILTGTADYVFGSRSAIFMPCPNLAKIVIWDEHEPGYKDERSPYFDTLTVAEKLQELTSYQIQIIDASPKVTTYSLSKQTRFVKVIQTGFVTTPKVKTVNMLAEKAAGNRSPISNQLETYLKIGFKKKKRILLFLNKKTESGHVYCRNCKYSDFANAQPETCPNCASADIWFNSLNVRFLASLVQKIVPGAKINIITTQLPNYPTIQLPTIDIATSSVFYRLATQKYDLVAHIRTDSLAASLDFSSTEGLFAQITDLKKLTRGLLLLQTYNPENEILKAAVQNNYLAFYRQQLAMRKTLSYPPFALLIRFSLKGRNEKNLEAGAQRLFDTLNQSIVNGQLSTVSILGPYKSTFGQKVPKYNIITKIVTGNYSLKTREDAIKLVEPLLNRVPRNWQIIVEPDSLN